MITACHWTSTFQRPNLHCCWGDVHSIRHWCSLHLSQHKLPHVVNLETKTHPCCTFRIQPDNFNINVITINTEGHQRCYCLNNIGSWTVQEDKTHKQCFLPIEDSDSRMVKLICGNITNHIYFIFTEAWRVRVAALCLFARWKVPMTSPHTQQHRVKTTVRGLLQPTSHMASTCHNMSQHCILLVYLFW